jgi:hypothetical protein
MDEYTPNELYDELNQLYIEREILEYRLEENEFIIQFLEQLVTKLN